ncbi:MAG: type II secretion system F family protein [Aquisalinus sp.]|nr:type II secretion system F family protein [Aquisalinus sp.]
MDSQTIILIVLGLVSVSALSYVILAPTEKDKAKTRAAKFGSGTTAPRGKAGAGANAAEAPKDRRKQVQESLRRIDDKQKEHEAKKNLSLSQKLEQAGLRISERDYYVASAICAVAFLAIALITAQSTFVTGAMFIVGGLGFPRFALGFLKKRRQKKFIKEFATAIEVIVRGVKSGLPVNECLKIIGRDAQQPVRDEFYMLTESIRVGLSLEQALERMYDRMPLNEVNFFGIVLIIQKQTGGNLAEALNNLATVLRNRKLMEGKISALSMEAKASAVILGSLPFMVASMVHIASPVYLMPLFETQIGNFILIGAGTWMAIGILVMKNMISIKV